jgi:hypothetical protein
MEYRLRVEQAREWVTDQHLHPSNMKNVTGAGPSQELYAKAAERYGLDPNWYLTKNRIMDRIYAGR